ncbi:MAG: M6 family metalloprotease domain-containing protein [Candidatus Electryonea clarkiae]|nr:M6 family metalloprotease domain-containing protein [Candidatus Electryonea clarkiae]MDP8285801.1 M6 family metalloprotease domain-containing protein [Candidatus Electryonea clarkiae]
MKLNFYRLSRLLTPALFLIIPSLFVSHAMPPHPELLRQIREGLVDMPYYMSNPREWREHGIDMPRPNFHFDLNELDEDYNVLVLLMDYSDNQRTYSSSQFDNLVFGYGDGKVRDYFDENSYGQFNIVSQDLPSSTGWIRMPRTYANYLGGLPDMPWLYMPDMIEYVVDAVDESVDFSDYDNDGDGVVDAFTLVHAGMGAENAGVPNAIHSHMGWVDDIYVDDVSITTYCIMPERTEDFRGNGYISTIGVYVHEMSHLFFGLPDLYDRDGSSAGLGAWSLMAGGGWNGPRSIGGSPSHLDAWSKIQVGFVTPLDVTYNIGNEPIHNVVNHPDIYRLWSDGITNVAEYFLIENRQRTGYDSSLPGEGFFIYHVDETVNTQNDNEWYPDFTDEGHYLVALEQADGNWDLEQNVNPSDPYDPYPGMDNVRLFNRNTIPDSRFYNGEDSQVEIKDISDCGMEMRADLIVDDTLYGFPPSDLEADIDYNNRSLTLYWNHVDHGVNDTLVYDNGINEGVYNWVDNVMATRMSPSGSCKILELWYGTTNYRNGMFDAKIFNWINDFPANMLLFSRATGVEDGWTIVNISNRNIIVNGDFLVGFGSINEDCELKYNTVNNQRAWNYIDNTWERINETYFIRAVVQYREGMTEILEPAEPVSMIANPENGKRISTPGELDDFLHFEIIRDDRVIGTALSTFFESDLNAYGTFTFRVRAVYDQGISLTSEPLTLIWDGDFVGENDAEIKPSDWKISTVYPNPFNSRVQITVTVPEASRISLGIYNLNGQLVQTLSNSYPERGEQKFEWNAAGFASGIYFVKADFANNSMDAKKILLIR